MIYITVHSKFMAKMTIFANRQTDGHKLCAPEYPVTGEFYKILRSTGDAYSSLAPDPASDISRGPCTPILRFVFSIGLMILNTVRYFCHVMHVFLGTVV
jgi:hypothetical protein